jgi:superfamily II DNA or RNA helicase
VKVTLQDLDHTFVKVITSPDIEREIEQNYTFFVPGHRFMPLFKAKRWDGKARLYNRTHKTIYRGLAHRIKEYCDSIGYGFEYQFPREEFDKNHVFNIKPQFEVRDYQMASVIAAIEETRLTLESPTASGKSLIIWLLIDYFMIRTQGKFLVVVPTLDLVSQMKEDFISYSTMNIEDDIYELHGNQRERLGQQRIVVSTWQSIQRKGRPFYEQFCVMFGDEAHEWKADATKRIAVNSGCIKYKFGTTGSTDIRPLFKLTTEGLFGKHYVTATTQELIERNYLAAMKPVKMIELFHPQITEKMDFDTERKYLIGCKSRNNFIVSLAESLKGIVLVLFWNQEHGEELFDAIKSDSKFLFYGKVKKEVRKEQRNEIKDLENACIVASTGVFSRGINITHIAHIILASPTKDRIKLIQMIGRGLRPDDRKEFLTLYDIFDRFNSRSQNVTYKHMKERIKVYEERGFKYKNVKLTLEG